MIVARLVQYIELGSAHFTYLNSTESIYNIRPHLFRLCILCVTNMQQLRHLTGKCLILLRKSTISSS